MAFLDGKEKPRQSGGNVQRESLGSGKAMPEAKTHGGEGGSESSTTIQHHADGSHTVQHHDGETSEHPSTGHMLMGLHAKHESGDGMHVHKHDGMPNHPHEGMEPHHAVTTHHVGMDGQVEGPTHHGSVDEAGQHMQQVMGEDGGNDAVSGMSPMDSEIPNYAQG